MTLTRLKRWAIKVASGLIHLAVTGYFLWYMPFQDPSFRSSWSGIPGIFDLCVAVALIFFGNSLISRVKNKSFGDKFIWSIIIGILLGIVFFPITVLTKGLVVLGSICQLLFLALFIKHDQPTLPFWAGLIGVPATVLILIYGPWLVKESMEEIMAPRQEAETYLIPEDYRGFIYVIFDQENGEPKSYERKWGKRRRLYVIPPSGVLFSQFSSKEGKPNAKYFLVNPDGHREKLMTINTYEAYDHNLKLDPEIRVIWNEFNFLSYFLSDQCPAFTQSEVPFKKVFVGPFGDYFENYETHIEKFCRLKLELLE